MDPELMELIGMKPTGSPDARDIRKNYLTRLRDQVKGEEVGRIKVRMKERHIVEGQGVVIHKGKVLLINEKHFDAMNKKVGGKLERVDKAEAPQERKTVAVTRDMKPEDAVTKD